MPSNTPARVHVAPAHASVLALEALLEFPREMETRDAPSDDNNERMAVRALMRDVEKPALARLLALLEPRCSPERTRALLAVVTESLAATEPTPALAVRAHAAYAAVCKPEFLELASASASWMTLASFAPTNHVPAGTPLADAYLVRELAHCSASPLVCECQPTSASARRLFSAACAAGRLAYAHYAASLGGLVYGGVAAQAVAYAGNVPLLTAMLEPCADTVYNASSDLYAQARNAEHRRATSAGALIGAAAGGRSEALALVLERFSAAELEHSNAVPRALVAAVFGRQEHTAEALCARLGTDTIAVRAAAASGWLEYLQQLQRRRALNFDLVLCSAIVGGQLALLKRVLDATGARSDRYLQLARAYGRAPVSELLFTRMRWPKFKLIKGFVL